MATATSTPPYVRAAVAMDMLGGLNRYQLNKLVGQGLIGVRKLPGITPFYRLADIERLIAESERPATRAGA